MKTIYHGSKVQNLKVIKPFKHNVIDGEKAVFASPDKRFCLAMTYGSGKTLAAGYHQDTKTNKKEFYIDELKKDALKQLDKPASLYVLASKNFTRDKRLMREEKISRKQEKVLKELKIKNVLKELKKLKVKIITYDKVPASMKKRKKDMKKPKIKYKKDRFNKVK